MSNGCRLIKPCKDTCSSRFEDTLFLNGKVIYVPLDQNKIPIFKLCTKKRNINVRLLTEMLFYFKVVK